MKDKKFKYLEDLLEEYIQLSEDETELNLSLEKTRKKFSDQLSSEPNSVYKLSDANDIYKAFSSNRKHEQKLHDLQSEKQDTENMLKEFLQALNGGKISYERKEDDDKGKSAFIFWLEEDKIKYKKQ